MTNMTAKRTRACIIQSFRELAKEKLLEEISVNDIIQESKVSRSTFYRYFKDKYDVMEQDYCEQVRQIGERDELSWQEIQLKIAQFYWLHREYYCNLMASYGQNSFFELAYSQGIALYTRRIEKRWSSPCDEKMKFHIEMYNRAGSAMYALWLSGKLELPVELFCAYLYDSMPEILQKALM